MIGIGNALRGDDRVGLEVARSLAGTPGLDVREHEGEGVDLIAMWQGADAVVLVDAIASGAHLGTVLRFDAVAAPLPAQTWRRAGHAVGVAEAIELARALHRLPPVLTVFGVEGARFGLGDGASPEVLAAVAPLAAAISRRGRDGAR